MAKNSSTSIVPLPSSSASNASALTSAVERVWPASRNAAPKPASSIESPALQRENICLTSACRATFLSRFSTNAANSLSSKVPLPSSSASSAIACTSASDRQCPASFNAVDRSFTSITSSEVLHFMNTARCLSFGVNLPRAPEEDPLELRSVEDPPSLFPSLKLGRVASRRAAIDKNSSKSRVPPPSSSASLATFCNCS
eukprot:CAMPEP_0169089014 /NCGR_PEP_ID=MMETSP1015-20121227/15060_1 /TAXON_ID=342587 /ORGANISM="Karlodinium micrum, Strain CCMP2283" /LENGTH=198 /DNA_ID=CAMNT_0009149325 /DNA_START=292 /DNA_END=888 /DNA_ORIENTATION=+